ncbi:MAG: hypothetical protein JW910_22215 [Anaerolineae bacterium]|nr:hypothetical protein [Anaerolineae bacterium]
MSRSRFTPIGWAILILLLVSAFGLRLWDLNEPSIWHDEAWSIRAIRDPIGTPDDNTPPVYYALNHLLWRGAGESPLALRYGSVLLGMMTVALAASITLRWAGWEAALLTAVLVGLSPLLWAYSREVRAYVAVPLLALVLLWLTDRLLAPCEGFPWRAWAGMLIAEVILLYTHNLSVPVVAWLNVTVGAVWLWQRRWRFLAVWGAGQLAVFLVYLPWLLGQSPSGTPLNTPPRVELRLIWDVWQAYFAPVPAQLGAEQALEAGSALFGLVALGAVGIVLTVRRDRRGLLVLWQAILLPVLATVELMVAHIDFHSRYYVAGVPAALMLVALAVNRLSRRSDVRRMTIAACVALAAWVSAVSLGGLLDDPAYQHDDFRALAGYYARLPDDAIIVIPYGWEPALEEYYADEMGIRAEIVGIDLHSSADAAMDGINAALARHGTPVHVELLTWYQLPADVRGMYPCLLEAAGQPAGAPFTVQGITTQGYTVTGPLTLVSLPDAQADYGKVVLVEAASGGQRSVCVRTAWRLEQPASEDWRVTGRLLTTDPPGWTVARSDTDIRQDDQAPTSEWKPSAQGEAFTVLRYPDGSPPGDYSVQIGVYSLTDPRGLDRLTNGIPSGKMTNLATVQPSGMTMVSGVLNPGIEIVVSPEQGVQLVGYDAQDGPLSSGQELRITVQWRVSGGCCTDSPWTGANLVLRGEGWEIVQSVRAYAAYSLDWHTFVIPPEASGPALLHVESGAMEPVVLATYTVEKTDRLFAPPSFEMAVQAEFDGLAVLEGFNVAEATVTPDQTVDLTLIWRAVGTPDVSYRVFTHLLNADGQVIAQHDGYPVENTRLTPGWLPGEYLVDRHRLVFERDDYRGAARLEVGFYDPETNTRVLLPTGADHVILPIEITVQ